MSKFHFEACEKDLTRRVFGVPGRCITHDELGFAVDFRKRTSTFSKRLNPEIVFHTVDRLVPADEYGNWINYLEGYEIPEISHAISDGFGEAKVLLGQYERKADGLVHFYVFSHQGKPYFEKGQHYSGDLPSGIYIVDLRYGKKYDAETFNDCYEQSLKEAAFYYRAAQPTEAFPMKVYNIFVVPMDYRKAELQTAGDDPEYVITTYQEIYRQFLNSKIV